MPLFIVLDKTEFSLNENVNDDVKSSAYCCKVKVSEDRGERVVEEHCFEDPCNYPILQFIQSNNC